MSAYLSRWLPLVRSTVVCLFVAGACCFAPTLALGQSGGIKSVDSRDIETLETRLENFFTTLAAETPTGGPEQAFKALLTGGPLAANEEKIKESIEQAKNLPRLYGKYNGFEKVKQGSIGKDVCVMTYLYKGQLYPVAWHFTFYRPDSSFSWVCIGVRFHSFQSSIEDLAK